MNINQNTVPITHAVQWQTFQNDTKITHAISLTDLMKLLHTVKSGHGCPDWHVVMHSLLKQRLLWVYCPGHAGVGGSERADRLASTADMATGLQLGMIEVVRVLRTVLTMDRSVHNNLKRDQLDIECEWTSYFHGIGWLVGCLTSQQHDIVYLRDRSAQTSVHASTLGQQLQIKLSPSHSILKPGKPVPALTLLRQAPGRFPREIV